MIESKLSLSSDAMTLAGFIHEHYDVSWNHQTVLQFINWYIRHGLIVHAYDSRTLHPVSVVFFRPTDNLERSGKWDDFYLSWEGDTVYIDLLINKEYIGCMWKLMEQSIGWKDSIAFRRGIEYDAPLHKFSTMKFLKRITDARHI